MLNMMRNQMSDRLRYGGAQFENFVAERTKARLYRGYLGDSGVMVPSEEGECTWNDVENTKGNPVTDLITDSMSPEYEIFKKEFSEQISAAGFNDHAIRDAIMLLFKDQYPGYQVHEAQIRRFIDRKLERLVIQAGNSDMVNSFLGELGLIDD